MDRESSNQAYQQGRLCAVLKVAHDIKGNEFARVNAAMASERPQKEMLTALTHSHLALKGQAPLEGEMEQIIWMLSPQSDDSRLSVEDQGLFWLGYYHEMKFIEDHQLIAPVTESIEQHVPTKVEPVGNEDNEIAELKR